MDSWSNGAKGSEVKRIIDNNFDVLDKKIAKINENMSKAGATSKNFVKSEWLFAEGLNTYSIFVPYSDYNKENPCVDIYIKDNSGYSLVYCGYMIEESGIRLLSDMPYEGRVVIR